MGLHSHPLIFAVDKQTPNRCNDRSTCVLLTHGALDAPIWAGLSAFAESSACCCLDTAQRQIAVRRASAEDYEALKR